MAREYIKGPRGDNLRNSTGTTQNCMMRIRPEQQSYADADRVIFKAEF